MNKIPEYIQDSFNKTMANHRTELIRSAVVDDAGYEDIRNESLEALMRLEDSGTPQERDAVFSELNGYVKTAVAAVNHQMWNNGESVHTRDQQVEP